MEALQGFYLEIWREASRQIEVERSIGKILELLRARMPIAHLILRAANQPLQSLESVAAASIPSEHLSIEPTTKCSEAKWQRLVAWADRQQITHHTRLTRSGELATIVPQEVDGELLVGPLVHDQAFVGCMILVAEHRITFKPEQVEIARHLLEPFAIALGHDRRWQELVSLREAAEADRQSLLRRLGRQEVNEAIIGAESGLSSVMERVEMVASSDVPVLILGDTGTGKEVVARAIHTRSQRSRGPFIRVNCGAIPSELIDSQLFGHEKGSFTGAIDRRKGWFERASGGTLFLDEMGELPLAAQVRLLRVLQEHQIERVGGHETVHVDVRIVAATHRDLAAMVKSGSFREDLWYRVNVFPILIPRLSERLGDIPALARHFAERAAARFGLPFVPPTAQDLLLLSNYQWPGNIRELQAVIDRASILGGGRRLEVGIALGPISPPQVTIESDEPTYYEVVPECIPSIAVRTQSPTGDIDSLDEAMKKHIELALQKTRGKIEGKRGAASQLKINPHTLRARMRKLKIDWQKYRPLEE